MPSQFDISKKLRTRFIYGGLLSFIVAISALAYGYIQFSKYAEPFTVEWAGEAGSIRLHFDKTNPYTGRFIFTGHTPFGKRIFREYLDLGFAQNPGIHLEHHRLYSAISGDPISRDAYPYLDYFALVRLKLVYFQYYFFSNNIVSTSTTSDGESSTGIYLESLFTKGLYKAADNALVDRLRFLLQKAEAGSYVRFSIFLFYYGNENEPLLQDILAAAERGVNVQLITDLPESDAPERRGVGQVFQEAFETRLSAASNGKSDSWIRRHADVAWDSKNHTKIFLFSNSAGFKNWVIITSENLTDTEREKHQAGLVMRDKLTYDAFDQYWDQILNGTYKDLWIASTGRSLTHYFFPQTTSEDAIYELLAQIKTTPQKMQQGKLLISMARWNFERFPLAMKLVELAEFGIKIEIITRNNPQIVDDVILKALNHRPNITLHTADVDRLNIHSKYILFDGYYRDNDSSEKNHPTKILWVGSHNFTGMAMRNNYETWTEVRDEKIFGDFLENFSELRSLVPIDPSSGSIQ